MYSQDDVIAAAREFLASVSEQGMHVSGAFIFGSYSHGKAGEDSDIDLAVVSSEFTGFRFDDLGKIAQAKIHGNKDLEVHPFAENDFTTENPFAAEIMAHGMRLL
jgi:uncharacterized protein